MVGIDCFFGLALDGFGVAGLGLGFCSGRDDFEPFDTVMTS